MRVQVKARNRSLDFETGRGEKILYAGLRGQVRLPYECATGTCGTCRARLVEGQIDELWRDAPGRKFAKAERGEFLMCQCAARGDLSIEVGGNVPEADPAACPIDARPGTVSAVRALTSDVMAFDVTLAEPCAFEAGQFMTVAAPGVGGMRGYSMVNFARPAQVLEFVIKKKPGGGFSEWLFSDSAAGAKIELFGPLGKATFSPGDGKHLLCIAGGSGIAGMMSILARAAQARHFDAHKGRVFFGIRTMQDAFFLKELSGYANVETTIALSEQEIPQEARQEWPKLRFERGFVHEVAKRAMAGRYENVRAYVAGPPAAVDAAIRVLLLEGKLRGDNIRYDKFS
jgi:toluene monooxygenase electron transfer component